MRDLPDVTHPFFNDATGATLALLAAAAVVLRDQRSYAPLLHRDERDAFGWLSVVAGTALALATTGCDLIAQTALPSGAWTPATQTALTVLGAVGASALVALGFRYRSTRTRVTGFVVFGLTIAKMYAFDLAALGSTERIVSALVLGTLLVVVAAWYQPAMVRSRRAA
ncbi:MAG TPA: DUF2339 domain-containing protein [Candidatus Sulfotelmatobacter sp.]|nr:DUF2339 domain-containing protein [Candidatus Sulfotelmatobacter sp.]